MTQSQGLEEVLSALVVAFGGAPPPSGGLGELYEALIAAVDAGGGSQGHQGFQGSQGHQGSQGNQGTQGPGVGSQGAQGFQGTQGTQGSGGTGPQGSQGHQGVTGTSGNQGTQGVAGSQGAQGFQGHQGANGGQGAQGSQGSTGTGSQGSQGAQGNTGGAQGAQGATGAQGAGNAGGPIVRKFAFAFNTANILTGATLYTPTIGDWLIDAWIEIDTAWNGTTPLCDVGQFVVADAHLGWWGFANAPFDPSTIDAPGQIGSVMLSQGNNVHGATGLYQIANATAPGSASATRNVPAKFTTTDPVKVCVSQNGKNNGADPGSSQGAGVVYLVTVTPV